MTLSRGRRPGVSTSRTEILHAARELFSSHGFEATTTRMIAQAAGVDQALVVRMFGGKTALFRVALQWPYDPAEEVPKVIAGARSRIGVRVAALFVDTWEDPAKRRPILALIRSATTHEEARRLLTAYVTSQVLVPIAVAIDADEPELRAELVSSHLIGLGLGRYVLAYDPLARIDRDRVVAISGAVVQGLLTKPLAQG